MSQNFVQWFISFGLSFLVSDVLGWTDQARAFMYVDIAVNLLSILNLIICGITICKENKKTLFFNAIITIASLPIRLLIVWFGATKIFNVDFYVAYQIMTFGQCLCQLSGYIIEKFKPTEENKNQTTD